jgi:hypothetical protein
MKKVTNIIFSEHSIAKRGPNRDGFHDEDIERSLSMTAEEKKKRREFLAWGHNGPPIKREYIMSEAKKNLIYRKSFCDEQSKIEIECISEEDFYTFRFTANDCGVLTINEQAGFIRDFGVKLLSLSFSKVDQIVYPVILNYHVENGGITLTLNYQKEKNLYLFEIKTAYFDFPSSLFRFYLENNHHSIKGLGNILLQCFYEYERHKGI